MVVIDSERPDPDALLAQLREQEQSAARGKLRIYFGSSAGTSADRDGGRLPSRRNLNKIDLKPSPIMRKQLQNI